MNSIVIPPSPNWYSPDILACAPDGTTVYGSNVSIVIINPKPEDQPADIKLISLAHHERISSISLNSTWAEGKKFIASSAEDKSVKVWNAESLELVKSHNSHTTNESKLIGAVFAGSDKVVSASEDGMVIVWKVSTNELSSLSNLFKTKVQVTSLSTCPHAPWLCAFGMKNGFIFIVDLRLTGQIKHKLRGHEKAVTDLTWCPAPVNIFPKLKTKQITLKDRLQKIYDGANPQEVAKPPQDRGDGIDSTESGIKDETQVEETGISLCVGNKQNILMSKSLIEESASGITPELNSNKTASDDDVAREKNTSESSAYKFKKNNPWVNLKHADDDDGVEEEVVEKKEVENDFLKECMSLRAKIASVKKEEVDVGEDVKVEAGKEREPRKILRARKPRRTEDYAPASNIEDDLFPSAENSISNQVDAKVIDVSTSVKDEIKSDLSESKDIDKSINELLKETDKLKLDIEKITDDMEKIAVAQPETIVKKNECIEKEDKSQDIIVNEKESVIEEPVKEFLLASAASNGTIIIWRAGTDGKVETKISVSSKNKFRNNRSSSSRDKIWISLCWISPTILLTSGSCGELLQWDFKNYTSSTQLKSKMIHNDHQSVLFSIAAPPVKTLPSAQSENWRDQLAAWTIGQERLLLKTTIDLQRKTVSCYQTLGNSVQCLQVSPIDPNKLAMGTADGFIKIWDLSRPHFQRITMSAIKIKPNGKVLCIAHHPEQENVLAYGMEDGHIGLVNPNCPTKQAALLVHYFRSSIYKLEWGPIKSKEEIGLYACSEGVLILYDVKNPLDAPTVIQTPDGKYITQFAWKQDYSQLALGTKDGGVFLFTHELEFQMSLFYQQKSIGALFWHPVATIEDDEVSPYESWLASSTSDGSIVVYDMKKSTNDTELSTRVVAEQKEHTKFIRALSWSPHQGGKLLSSSEDGSAHVWDVKNNKILSTYLNSYCQPITACTWSPLDKDYVILAGRQCILFIVNISDYKPMTKEDIQREMNRRKKKLGGNPIKEEKPKKVEETAPAVKKNVNSRDVMLTSVLSLQREKDLLLSDCRKLMALNDGQPDIDRNENQVLQLFGNQEDVYKLIEHQQVVHASKSKHGLNHHLSLWKGDIGESIKKAMAEGHLSPWLISMAPMVSPMLWQEACESYANQLAEDPNGDAVLAASYYLSCHKVEKAIEVLCLRKLYKEALVLAKCRLPNEKAIIDKIIVDWATYYIINGSFEVSAQCYIALEKYEDAAKALFKRSDLEILALAVELAEKTNNKEMINAIKLRYESFKADNETQAAETVLVEDCENSEVKKSVAEGDSENKKNIADRGENSEVKNNSIEDENSKELSGNTLSEEFKKLEVENGKEIC